MTTLAARVDRLWKMSALAIRDSVGGASGFCEGVKQEQATAKAKYRGLSTALRFGRDDGSCGTRERVPFREMVFFRAL
jgi:hypothetical protein